MEQSFQKGVVLHLASLIEYTEGGVISKQLIKSPVGNITLFSFDKGEGLSEHRAPFDALVQVLEGGALLPGGLLLPYALHCHRQQSGDIKNNLAEHISLLGMLRLYSQCCQVKFQCRQKSALQPFYMPPCVNTCLFFAI